MKNFRTNIEWLDRLMPEGMPVPSSTVISGPGGSGKPLVALAFVASWLRQGGKVALIPLQYPDRAFTENDLARLYRINLSDYEDSFCFVRLDTDLAAETGAIRQDSPNEIRANLVNPQTWTQVLERAEQTLGPSDLGMLVYSSALNLLLFSPKYGERLLSQVESMLRSDKSRTYLFTVSSSVLKEKIHAVEQAADHLMFAEMTEPEKKLHLRISRLKNALHLERTIRVPFEREVLESIKEIAEVSRVANVASIRRI